MGRVVKIHADPTGGTERRNKKAKEKNNEAIFTSPFCCVLRPAHYGTAYLTWDGPNQWDGPRNSEDKWRRRQSEILYVHMYTKQCIHYT
jgi:hypothetical protein